MVVMGWGQSVTSEKVKSIPLWVKISSILDSYWTHKGISRFDSVVGPPVCADAMTSKLKILPFAKICVKHELGTSLPNSVKVTTLGPVTNERISEV